MAHDASSTWSGYQYQGKVAIYYVLRLINQMLVDDKEESISNFNLEIEYLEDFAIKNRSQYISAHQVKAKNSATTINGYLDAIINIYENEEEIPYYLHTSVEITNWSKDGLVSTLDNKITNKQSEINKLDEEDSTKKSKLQEEIEGIKILLKSAGEIFNKVALFEYKNNQVYCGVDEIKGYIEEEILKYYKNTNQQEKTGKQALFIAYIKLIGEIDKHIKDRHLKKVSKNINFEIIQKILDEELSRRDEQFHIYVLKEIFQFIEKEEFCINCKLSGLNVCESDIDCILPKFVNEIDELNLNQFIKFIKTINPHVLIKEIDEFNRYNYAQKNQLAIFYNIIKSIDKMYQIEREKPVYKGNSTMYLPTTILVEDLFKDANIVKYCKEITKNDEVLEDLFESNILITGNVNKEDLFSTTMDMPETEERLKKDVEDNKDKHIFKKFISLRELSKVLEELS